MAKVVIQTVLLFLLPNLLFALPCYNEEGKATFCEPEFTNIAQRFQQGLEANSTCGAISEETVCQVFPTLYPTKTPQCEFCDARGSEERRHPIESVTDIRVGLLADARKTCWMSQPGSDKPAMIEINFGKMMEALYIIMRFCNEPPRKVTIYKSTDFSATWYPIHYISENCIGDFGIDPKVNVFGNQPSCARLEKSSTSVFGLYSIAQNAGTFNNSDPAIRMRKEATGLRFILEGYPELPSGMDKIAAYKYFSLSSIEIGGQCQCNGHSDICWNDGRRTKCECKHNTAGYDCEKCDSFYQDAPWQPATAERAFECKPCNCNDHSDTCYFDPALYEASGRISGGVCTDCEHNTAGRSCERCREGYFRTPGVNITDRSICTKCNCHPIGSYDANFCDSETGQCKCKPGVAGQNCERCQEGYKISANNDIPCIPINDPLPDGNMLIADRPPVVCSEVNSGTCSSLENHVLGFPAYCDYNTVLEVSIENVQHSPDSTAFRARLKKHHSGPGQLPEIIFLNVDRALLDCGCIELGEDRDYVMLVNWPLTGSGGLKLLPSYEIKNTDTVLRSKGSLLKKVKKFGARKDKGKC
uniref:Netrin B n=1 Tax=Isodiametra pulchra TaxID=504439 RepID=A0A2P1DV73_ISOPU|nr:netrin B [Isodiametra pulchra]